MRKYCIGVIGMLAVILSVNGVAFSEEQVELDLEYAFGNVKSVTGKVVTIEGYDDDNGEEIDIAFNVADDVKLEGIESIAQLVKDSWIDVGYVAEDNKKVAYEIMLNE